MDTVRTRIGVFASSDDQQKIRFAKRNLLLFFVVLADKLYKFYEMLRTVFNLAASQLAFNECVASCHSSIRRGVSPSNKRDALVSAVARYSSRLSVACSSMMLAAFCFAVVVLPHHLGPSIIGGKFCGKYAAICNFA